MKVYSFILLPPLPFQRMIPMIQRKIPKPAQINNEGEIAK